MSIIVTTDEGIFWKNNYGESWTIIPGSDDIFTSPCYFTPVGYWGTVICQRANNKPPVFLGRGTISPPLYSPDANGNYDFEILDSYYLPIFGTGLHCACGYNGRILISHGATFYYSGDQGASDEGFLTWEGDYVNLPIPDYEITGLHNINGNLFIITTGKIWVMPGSTETIPQQSFIQEIITGKGAKTHISCIGDGRLFLANNNGIWIVEGRSAFEISAEIRSYWQSNFDADEAWLCFWEKNKWLFCKASNNAALLIYSLEYNEWYYITHFNPKHMATSNIGESWCLFGTKTCNTIKSFDKKTIGAAVTQNLQTPYSALGNRWTNNRIRRIYPNARNVDSIIAYLRMGGRGATYDNSVTLIPNDNMNYINCDLPRCNEISLKYVGSGNMIVDLEGPAIEPIEEQF